MKTEPEINDDLCNEPSERKNWRTLRRWRLDIMQQCADLGSRYAIQRAINRVRRTKIEPPT